MLLSEVWKGRAEGKALNAGVQMLGDLLHLSTSCPQSSWLAAGCQDPQDFPTKLTLQVC